MRRHPSQATVLIPESCRQDTVYGQVYGIHEVSLHSQPQATEVTAQPPRVLGPIKSRQRPFPGAKASAGWDWWAPGAKEMCQRCWGWLQRRVKLAQCWRDGLWDPDRPHAFSRPVSSSVQVGKTRICVQRDSRMDPRGEGERGLAKEGWGQAGLWSLPTSLHIALEQRLKSQTTS